jgi:hypothetical protein
VSFAPEAAVASTWPPAAPITALAACEASAATWTVRGLGVESLPGIAPAPELELPEPAQQASRRRETTATHARDMRADYIAVAPISG